MDKTKYLAKRAELNEISAELNNHFAVLELDYTEANKQFGTFQTVSYKGENYRVLRPHLLVHMGEIRYVIERLSDRREQIAKFDDLKAVVL